MAHTAITISVQIIAIWFFLFGISFCCIGSYYLIFLCGLQDAKSHLSWWSVLGSLQLSPWQPHSIAALDSGNYLTLYLSPVRIPGEKVSNLRTRVMETCSSCCVWIPTSERHMYYLGTQIYKPYYLHICFPSLLFSTVQAKLWISAQNVLQVSSCSFVCLFGWLICV